MGGTGFEPVTPTVSLEAPSDGSVRRPPRVRGRTHNRSMEYSVITKATEEGVSAWVPGLPGCWSEGHTEQEALANIQEAIADYLLVASEISRRESGAKSHLVQINVA